MRARIIEHHGEWRAEVKGSGAVYQHSDRNLWNLLRWLVQNFPSAEVRQAHFDTLLERMKANGSQVKTVKRSLIDEPEA